MKIKTAVAALHRRLVPPLKFGWMPYLWLVYFGFFFVEYLFRPPGMIETIAIVATVIAFVVVYFSAYRRKGRAALIHIGLLALLGVVWAGYNAGSSVLFIYAASFAYCVGPPRRAAWVVAVVAGLAALTAWLAQPMLMYWLPGAAISVVIGTANILFAENERKDAELRLSQAEVQRLARVAERERIARDLHDVLGHTLSLITVQSALAARLVDSDPARARSAIEGVEQTARNALGEVRSAIGGLHEQSLDEALAHVEASLRAADIELTLDREPGIEFTPQTQAMLALVIREAVTNILRHADARHCRIALVGDGPDGRLEIADDGRGGLKPDGSGVQGMRARVESLGGELDVESGPGTRLVARLPTATLQS